MIDFITAHNGGIKMFADGTNLKGWGKTAETLQEYLLKGRQIYVEGRLQTREWQDRDGNKRYTTETRADRVVLLGGRGNSAGDGSGGSQERQAEPPSGSGDTGGLTEDDIPF